MARVELDFRSFLKQGKCEVPVPKMVNLDIRDESPPNSNYGFTDLLCMRHLTQSGNTLNDNSPIETNVSSQLTLSPLTNDKLVPNQQRATSSDVSLSDLFNGIDAQVVHSDQKAVGFTNSLCNTDSCSMKFKDDSECEVSSNLSDILSGISIQDCDPALQKSFNKSISPVLDVSLSDIALPELCEIQQSDSSSCLVQDLSFKNTQLPTESSFNVDGSLSDILSSINIDTHDHVAFHPSTESSSLHSENKNTSCLGDFSIQEELYNAQLSDFHASPNAYSECGNSVDSLSLTGCDDNNCALSLATLAKNHFLSNGTNEILNTQELECGNSSNKLAETEEVNFSFFDFSSDDVSSRDQITPSNCENGINNNATDDNDSCSSKSKLGLNEDLGFSFFPELSLNDLNGTLAKNHFLRNGTNEILNTRELECGNSSNKLAGKNAEVNFSFFDFSSDDDSSRNQITLSNCEKGTNNKATVANGLCSSKSKLGLNKDSGFSFFPEPSLNDLNGKVDNIKNTAIINRNDINEDNNVSMLDLLNSVNIPTCSTSVSKSNEDSISMLDLLNSANTSTRSISISESNIEDNISMLDLFNSVNTTRSTSVSESSSSLSDEVGKSDSSSPQNVIPDEDDDEIFNIDLSMCIKSPDNNSSFNPSDILKQNSNVAVSSEIPPTKPPKTFEDDIKYSLPLKTFTIPENSRLNVKQSLFAKAVACKPKKDPTLMQKVAKIKCELFKNIFCRPVPVKSDGNTPQKATAIYSNECMISCTGRRIFAPRAPCEFQ